MMKAGFVAMGLVGSFALVSFLILSLFAAGTWTESKNLIMATHDFQFRLNSLSCANIARAKMYFGGIPDGEYWLGSEVCRIDYADDSLKLSSGDNIFGVVLRAEIDPVGFGLKSIRGVLE